MGKVWVRCVIWCLLYLAAWPMWGQMEEVHPYSEETLDDFAYVYMTSKRMDSDIEAGVRSLIAEHDISESAYAGLIKRSIDNDLKSLSEADQLIVVAIREKHDDLAREKADYVKALCRKRSLPLDAYEEILAYYRQHPRFQNSMYPYFRNYFDN